MCMHIDNISEGEMEKLILVVCGREFEIDRETLISRNEYFKTMFKKHFIESKKRTIELKGVPSAESFAVLLEYILHERIGVVTNARVFIDSLSLSKMYLVDGFKEDLRNDILLSWPSIENMEDLIRLAELLNVTDEILEISMNSVWKALCLEGKEFLDELEGGQREVQICTYFDEGDRGISPNRMIRMIAVEDFKQKLFNFRKSSFDQNLNCFLGILSWVNRYGFVEANVEHLFLCLDLRFLSAKEASYYLNKIEELTGEKHILSKRIEGEFLSQRAKIAEHVNKIIVGSLNNNTCVLSRFDVTNWKWDNLYNFTIMYPHFNYSLLSDKRWYLYKRSNDKEYHFLTVPNDREPSEPDLDVICSHSLVQKQRSSSVFLNNDRVDLDYHGNAVLHDGNVYFAGSTRTLGAYTFMSSRLGPDTVHMKARSKFRICKYSPSSWHSWHTTFAELDLQFDRLFCHLLVDKDMLYCVVSYSNNATSTWTTGFFSLDLSKEPCDRIQFVTLFDNCTTDIRPVSLTSLGDELMVVFSQRDSLWFTLYDPQKNRFKPLGFVPRDLGSDTIMQNLQISVKGFSTVVMNNSVKNEKVLEEWLTKTVLIQLPTPLIMHHSS